MNKAWRNTINKEKVSDAQNELSFGWKETEIQKYTAIFQKEQN